MDSDRFDAFARTISSPGSRRAALASLLGGVLGLFGLLETEAGRRDKKRRRRQRRRQKRERRRTRRRASLGPDPSLLCDQVPECNVAPTLCNQGGAEQCVCLKMIGIEAGFCTGDVREVSGCGDCESGEFCVFYDNECDPPVAGCAKPCADPA